MSKHICALAFLLLATAAYAAAPDRYGNSSTSPAPPADVGQPPRDSAPPAGGPSLLMDRSADDQYKALPSDAARADTTQPARPGAGNVSAPPPMRSVVPPAGLPAGVAAPPTGYGSRNNSASSDTTPPADAGTRLKPSSMMRAMLTPPAGSRLPGQPVRLNEVVAGATSRVDQSQRVEAYWDLCATVADYYLGVREQDEMQKLQAMSQPSGTAWQQAQAELGTRIGTSLKAAVASQLRLAALMGRPDSGYLPLPADAPHCGDYYTRYDQVFANRSSSEARQLSELLPLRYQELKDASTAVARSEEWLDSVANQRGTASDGTGTLRAAELLALQRRAFVQIVRDYNRRIARYAELSSPGQINSSQLISMLVKRDGAPSTSSRSSAPAAPANRQSQDDASGQNQTFVQDWAPASDGKVSQAGGATRDDAVKPSSAESDPKPHVEHSLLVPPE